MTELDFNLVLESDKILLRPTIDEDYNSFKDLTADKSMWIYFTCDLSVHSELKAWIKQAISENQNKTRLAFTIIDKNSSLVVGSTSFGNTSYRDKRIEIGWTWIAQTYHGKGINREIKHLMLDYCFETLDYERVEFKTDVLNVPARKALLKLGAIEEGILRSHTLMTHGRRRDTIYYSILRKEWSVVKLM
jgi:RimJ/RimL family protein N-acetyltransferase